MDDPIILKFCMNDVYRAYMKFNDEINGIEQKFSSNCKSTMTDNHC